MTTLSFAATMSAGVTALGTAATSLSGFATLALAGAVGSAAGQLTGMALGTTTVSRVHSLVDL